MDERNRDFCERMHDRFGASKGWLSASNEDSAVISRAPLARREPLGVARPRTAAEVAAMVTLCGEFGVPILTPEQQKQSEPATGSPRAGIILSLGRMNRVLSIDPIGFTATVEAGADLETLHDALSGEGLAFPIPATSGSTAEIGQLIRDTANEGRAIQDLVIAMDAVLPDGRVWNGTRNAGRVDACAQLRQLFCGTQARLCVVTGATLRVFPAATGKATALLALDDLAAATKVAILLRNRAGEFLTALKFFCDGGLRLALESNAPLARLLPKAGRVYLLVELSTSVEGVRLDDILDSVLSVAKADGKIRNVKIADDEAQGRALRRLLGEIAQAQARVPGRIDYEITLAFKELAGFAAEAAAELNSVLTGTRVHARGDLSNGTIRLSLLPPIGRTDFAAREAELAKTAGRLADLRHGRLVTRNAHTGLMGGPQSSIEKEVMRRIMLALDPDGILNSSSVRDEASDAR